MALTQVQDAMVGPQASRAKAWANINGSTGTIRSSMGVSSLTKNATGDYSLNLPAGVVPDGNYCLIGTAEWTSGSTNVTMVSLKNGANTATLARFQANNLSSALNDSPLISVVLYSN